jgi:peptidoglycan/LPS O-acetylase OafA/YrhL
MLGALRFVLALLVVLNHLWLPTVNKIGAHAVIAFYVISGFMMTRILCETYVGQGGLTRYFANRFLRLFPGYWLVAILTLIGLVGFPQYFGNIYSTVQIPQSVYEWLQNITLFDLPRASRCFVPPAWSLSVEWVFYIIIGTGISRRVDFSLVWWLASAAYTVRLIMSGATFGDRYTPPAAASFFFASGAVIYHVTKSVPKTGRLNWFWWMQLGIFCVFPLVMGSLGHDRHMLGFYGAFVLFIPLFIQSVVVVTSEWGRMFDRLLGDLTYPMFLSHFLASGLANFFTGKGVVRLSFVYFLISLFLCFLISLGIVGFLDPAVNRLRDQIRPKKC